MLFQNREDAGAQLAQKLTHLQDVQKLLVLGLPRGGVVTAAEISSALRAPLEVIICRKIGAPGNEEFAIGAISEAGGEFLNPDIVGMYGIDREHTDKTIEQENKKIILYQKKFRNGKLLPSLKDKTVILTDDGAATGMTMKAAIDAARKQHASKIIVALPVAPSDTAQELRALADETVILETPPHFQAVGQFYAEFSQVETDEVQEILKNARRLD